MYCIIIKMIYLGFSGIFGIILYELLIFNIILFCVVLKMSETHKRSLRWAIISKLNEYNNGICISQIIDNQNLNTIELFHSVWSDDNAKKWLYRLKEEIKLYCKIRHYSIKTIVFPTVCRLGRNTIMLDFFKWIFKYDNNKISLDIQIFFVCENILVNAKNFNKKRSEIEKYLINANNEIKKNSFLSGNNNKKRKSPTLSQSDIDQLDYINFKTTITTKMSNLDIKESSDNKFDDEIPLESNCVNTLLILRHSSDRSYIPNKKQKYNTTDECPAFRKDFPSSRHPDDKCKNCGNMIMNHKNNKSYISSIIDYFKI